jgi:hypothetical protein
MNYIVLHDMSVESGNSLDLLEASCLINGGEVLLC